MMTIAEAIQQQYLPEIARITSFMRYSQGRTYKETYQFICGCCEAERVPIPDPAEWDEILAEVDWFIPTHQL